MNDLSAIQSETPLARPAERPATRPLDLPRVAEALAEIADDSQRSPETYLRDTVVPHGGE